tara:strand:+ start:3464 stop:3991 length:528 start_codon:yes stop_codon:yes gene_type:complete
MKKILTKWGFSKRGIFVNSKGEWYLFAQILLIFLHLLPKYPKSDYILFPINILLIIIGIIISFQGLIIVIIALIELGDNLTPLPYPMEDSILIKTNSYNKSRHPIYKGLLLISMGIFIFTLSLIHLSLFVLLAYTLKTKALIEEDRLKIKFPEYENYIKDVPAIMKNIIYLDWRS